MPCPRLSATAWRSAPRHLHRFNIYKPGNDRVALDLGDRPGEAYALLGSLVLSLAVMMCAEPSSLRMHIELYWCQVPRVESRLRDPQGGRALGKSYYELLCSLKRFGAVFWKRETMSSLRPGPAYDH